MVRSQRWLIEYSIAVSREIGLSLCLLATISLPLWSSTRVLAQEALSDNNPVVPLDDDPLFSGSQGQLKPLPLSPLEAPLDLKLLKYAKEASLPPGICPDANEVVFEQTICQKGLTVPSLWWQRDREKRQFGGRLFENWFAYPVRENRESRVDLVVNLQLWSLLNYLERYEVVNSFGNVAKQYGYNTRVFSPRGNFLAAYTCDFNTAPETTSQTTENPSEVDPTELRSRSNLATCSILLDSGGKGSVRGGGSSLF